MQHFEFFLLCNFCGINSATENFVESRMDECAHLPSPGELIVPFRLKLSNPQIQHTLNRPHHNLLIKAPSRSPSRLSALFIFAFAALVMQHFRFVVLTAHNTPALTTSLPSLPPQEFLVWRYPRTAGPDPQKENMDLDIDQQMLITGEEFDRVVRGKCRSIYQSDYVGLPQGADVSGAFADLPEDPRARLKYSRESTNRIVHAAPSPLPHELRVPTTRFGAKKDRAAAYGSRKFSAF